MGKSALALSLAQGADLTTTIYALSHGLVEVGLLSAPAYALFGIPGLLVVKIVSVSVGLALLTQFRAQKAAFRLLLIVLVGIGVIPAVGNLIATWT